MTLLDDLLGQLVGHVCGRGVAPPAVLEEERLVELDCLTQGQRLLEVFFGFAGETHDDVGAQADVGTHGAELGDDLEEALPGVSPVHELEQTVGSALDGQVRAFHQFWQATVGFDEVVAVALGMRRGEADAVDAFDGVDRFDELNEGAATVLHRNRPTSVAGDDLAQQGDLADSARGQFTALGHDVVHGPAAFFASGGRHDAEGAVLVAALHDADESRDRSGVIADSVAQMFTNG